MTPDLIAGRYRVVRAVGKGGMGTVWLCADEMLGREVAVKQIGSLPGESATDTARALREARSSAALNHKNVVSVFDVVDGDGGAWLVMEYVPSRTLAELVRDEGPLDARRAAMIGAQIADGLAAAHAAGTIHRDVKPGNVLVTEDGTAKISDFGIARMDGGDQITRTGLVTGTPSYFSPELARGEDPDASSDVYALGATLYTAVEGEPPYPEHRNALALLQTIAAQEPEPPHNAGPLAGPISRMMDRDPSTRWSMADAAHALHRVADGGSAGPEDHTAVMTAGTVAAAAAPPADPAPRVTPGYDEDDDRRSRTPLLVAALLLLLVLALGAGYALLAGEDDPERRPAAQNTPTRSDGPSDEPSSAEEPTPEGEPTPEEQEEPEPEPEPGNAGQEQPASGGRAQEQAVEEYFATVPEDTDAGWARLSPRMQEETGRDDYESWWGSVERVDLADAHAVPGQDAVDVTLTYHFDDGSATEERQRLTLVRSDGGYLIDDDEVLSSRTVS
jgi:serine/threonine protein kinase